MEAAKFVWNTEDDLIKILITDGISEEIKREVIDILKKREYDRGYDYSNSIYNDWNIKLGFKHFG